MTTNEINQNQVVLELLGIDKKWVRSPEGTWIDEKTLKKEKKEIEVVFEDEQIPKSWWKFWGK